jgi:glycosyltransferase involved in cell wall biosynthesis
MNAPDYVLVTPVRNEEATIGVTLESVVNQSVRPLEWVIVSDGSTDRTDSIIEPYAAKYPFIRLLRLTERPQRSFSSVVFATEAGIAHLKHRDCEFIGLLDADIRLGRDYYSEVLRRFQEDARLGLGGGLVVDHINGQRVHATQAPQEVAGAVQFFRRACFDSMGGLTAIAEGGWDAITCVQARMNGFTTRTFVELEVDHLKPRNISEGNVARRHFQFGVRDHALGNHPLFEALKCLYRCADKPWIIGGAARYAGYLWCVLTFKPRSLPRELVAHIRGEQLARMMSVRLLPRRARRAHAAEAAGRLLDVIR